MKVLYLKEEFEKEVKSKSRLSMEKEELQWRLKQAMEVPGASTQETSFSFRSPVQLVASVAPTLSFFNSNVSPFGFSTPTLSFQPTSSENPFSVSAINKNPPRKIRRTVRRTARK
ncbi:uncharacterized protein LOC143234000 [Tachypleus tridentatus]|uniref:uncharacterized protein LOC143234000 n=1 Tax=Tachypleus tridentatus TaxID=6853 RepID=UPI003FD36336